MTPRRKLIEVALPLEAINAASAREKSIRHGHPSTLHLWWARRPLAACRAVLFAQLVDDPSSWPERFEGEEEQGAERKRLHDFIAQLVRWESSNDERILNEARWYIARSLAWGRGEEPPSEHDPEAVRQYLLDHAPPVYDPFCGGGSIPLEAQRLGLRAYGSDLNPVAVMISKALVEFPPKFAGLPPVNPEARKKLANGGTWNAKGAQGLAEDVRYYGRWMRDEAKKRIGHLYPEVELPDGSKATVIAWLWARTVASPNPACHGAYVPLVSNFMLSTKTGKEAWVEPVLEPTAPDGYRFEVHTRKISHQETEQKTNGTKAGGSANFRCLLTGTIIERAHIVAEGRARRLGARLMAIIADGPRGRTYVSPVEEHERIAGRAKPTWTPETDLPKKALGFRVQEYGITKHRDLFTPRQLVALTTFSDLVLEARAKTLDDARADAMAPDSSPLTEGGKGAEAYADAIAVYLMLSVSRSSSMWSSNCWWQSSSEYVAQVFTRHAILMIWDFAEVNPFSKATGNFIGAIEWIAKVLHYEKHKPLGKIDIKNAQDPASWPRGAIIFTDPPYYDNVSYSDLSDFYYTWMRASMRGIYPNVFSTILVANKQNELIAEPFRHGDRERAEHFFVSGMSIATKNMERASAHAVPITIFYAFKQEEVKTEGVTSTGWATFLQAIVASKLQLDGTWPVRTERTGRLRDFKSNALASSIVLVCRKRAEGAASVTRGEFLRALRAELPKALHTLQESAIAPVDMAQASIGPGMAVFSRYKEVLEADDTRMSVREALKIINAELDEYLARQEGDYDSYTRFAVTWFRQHRFDPGKYGEAEVLANARDVAVQGVVEAGILEARAGSVRLLRREELPVDWDWWTDERPTIWEGTQHLIRRLESEGEESAARLAKHLGPYADMARDLAYRLFQVCERNKWAEEARAYNGLVESWREIIKIRDTLPDETTPGPREPELAL